MHLLRFTLLTALAFSLTACSSTETKKGGTRARRAPAPIVRINNDPVAVSPLTYQTCTQHYNFVPGSPQYKKCIANLSQIESKPQPALVQ